MKNANVFVDVDLTLVDDQQRLLPGAKEALHRLVEAGCHLYLWSTAGADYARKIAALHQLTELFEGFCPKPDILIDDMVSTVQTNLIFNVHAEGSWQKTVEAIMDRHIDA